MTRLTFTSNLLLRDDLAIKAVAARSWSRHEYYLPSNYGKAELAWTSREGVRLSLATTYLGRRKDEYLTSLSDGDAEELLGAAWWLEGGLQWTSPHRRIEAGVHVYNILGHTVDVYNFYPRFGRTAVATVTTRF